MVPIGRLMTLAFVLILVVLPTIANETYTNVTTFAGNPKDNSVFKEPSRVVALPDGQLLVADAKNHRIQRVSTAGVVSLVAGSGKSGSKDGPASVAEFKAPTGVAFDAARNLIYVVDTGNDRIRTISVDGNVSTLIASGLNKPSDVVVDGEGNLYVSDTGNGVIRRITPGGTMTTIAGDNAGKDKDKDGPALQATFREPTGRALTPANVLYIADSKNHVVRKLESGMVSTVAGSGASGVSDGAPLVARFQEPSGIALDGGICPR